MDRVKSGGAAIERLESRQLFAVAAGFIEAEFVTGLTNPTAFAFAPDGRLFVAEQAGDLRVVNEGALLPQAAISIDVDSVGERGLIGLTFDPAFADNQLIYLHYTAKTPVVHNRVSRFTLVGNTVDAGSEQVLRDLPPLTAATNHNGGAIHFGPDGNLYIAVGENNDPSKAQPLTTVFGKILRLNADGSIPADNPFINVQGGQPEIWARGLRNPYTFAFRSDGLMYINDVGQSSFEEINIGQAGGNYGWPIIEGKRTPGQNPPAGYVDPLLAYGRDGGPVSGFSIAGGAFYQTPAGATTSFPAEMEGDYLFADWGTGFVKSLDSATGEVSPVASGLSGPLDLAIGPDGAVYALEYFAGRVTRVSASPPALAITMTTDPRVIARQGQRDKVRLRIDNVGDVAFKGRMKIRLLASADGAVDPAGIVLKELSRVVSLKAGRGQNLNLRFRYPDTLDGAFTVLTQVVPGDDRVVQPNLITNAASATVLVSPPFIDLAPNFAEPSQTFTASGRNTVKIDVQNLGNVAFAGRVEVALSLTPASGAFNSVASASPRRVIPSQGQRSVPVRLKLPDGLPAGAYQLTATVLARGKRADTNPSNDNTSTSATV